MTISRGLVLPFVSLLSAASAWAQTTGEIRGTVRDAEGKPLAEVLVVVTGEALMGERSVVTGAQGIYLVPALPAGSYTLRFEASGYTRVILDGAIVPLGGSLVQDAVLSRGEVVESVTVVADPLLFDRRSANAGDNFDRTELDAMTTVARDFRDITKYLPSVTGVELNTVNGSRIGFPSIRGEGQEGDNYLVDGLTVRDPSYKTTSTPVPYDAIDEVQIITDGFAPEYGQALGGTVNVVTRSGGDAFKGEVAAIYRSDGSSAGAEPVLIAQPVTYSRSEPYVNAGGPILREKLWWFGSFGRLDQEQSYAPTEIPGLGTLEGGTEDTGENTYFGKLSGTISASHSLSANYTRRDGTTTGLGSAEATPEARTDQNLEDTRLRVDYKAILQSRAVLEVKYGFVTSDGEALPQGSLGPAPYELVDFGVTTHNADWRTHSRTERNDYAASLTWIFGAGGGSGAHTLKAGVDYHEATLLTDSAFTGIDEDVFPDEFDDGSRFQFVNVGPPASPYLAPVTMYEYLSGGAVEDKSHELGVFVQDRWEIGGLSILAGLRADQQRAYNNENQLFLDLGLGDAIAPRASVTWDIGSRGRDVLKAGWGRFYDVTGMSFFTFANTVGGWPLRNYSWNGSCVDDFQGHIDSGDACDIHNPANWSFVFEQSGMSNPVDFASIEHLNGLDRSLIEYDRRIANDYALEVRFVDSRARDLIDDVHVALGDFRLLNFDRKRRDYQSLELEFSGRPTPRTQFHASWAHSSAKGTNPGQFEGGGFLGMWGSGNELGVFGDRPPSDPGAYLAMFGPDGVPPDWLGDPRRDYNDDDAIDERDFDLFIQTTFAGLGGTDGDDGWYGHLPYSIDDQIKLAGSARLAKLKDLYVSGFLSWASGYHTERRGFNAAYGDYLTYSSNPGAFDFVGTCDPGDPLAGCTTVRVATPVAGQSFAAEDGLSRGTLENGSFWSLDLALGKVWQLPGRYSIETRLDCFNVFDEQTVVAIQQRAVTSFGEPVQRLAPRQFRGMVRFFF